MIEKFKKMDNSKKVPIVITTAVVLTSKKKLFN